TQYSFTLRAFESDGAQPPAHWTGYASKALTVAQADPCGPSGTKTGVSLALQPVSEAHVTGHVARGATVGSSPAVGVIWLKFADAPELPLAGGDPGTDFDYAVPRIDARETWITVSALVPGPPTN